MDVHGTRDKNYLQVKCTIILPLLIIFITGVALEIDIFHSLYFQKVQNHPLSTMRENSKISFPCGFLTWNFCVRCLAALSRCCPGSGGAFAVWDAAKRVPGLSVGAGLWTDRGGWRTRALPRTRFVKAVFRRSFRELNPFCRWGCLLTSPVLGNFLLK